MADTFEAMARRLLAYNAGVPQSLAEIWIRDRWRWLCEKRDWSFLRVGGQIVIPASTSTGTVAVTNGSATVVGTGTAWTSALINQQFKFAGQAPVYNITAVTDATHLTIEDEWALATSSGSSYLICQAWVTMPADFWTFRTIADPTNLWRLHTNFFDQTHLDRADPGRTSSGTPYIVAAFRDYVDPVTFISYVRYEMWPAPTALRAYPYTYFKRAPDLTATSVLPGIVTGDVLVTGALADLCRWPGPSMTEKNPMFNLSLASDYEGRFQLRCAELGRQDNEVYNTDLDYAGYPLAPLSAQFMQSHGMMEFDTGGGWW